MQRDAVAKAILHARPVLEAPVASFVAGPGLCHFILILVVSIRREINTKGLATITKISNCFLTFGNQTILQAGETENRNIRKTAGAESRRDPDDVARRDRDCNFVTEGWALELEREPGLCVRLLGDTKVGTVGRDLCHKMLAIYEAICPFDLMKKMKRKKGLYLIRCNLIQFN